MKVLIAGGTGFLGSKLSEKLVRLGHEVILLTRKNPSLLQPTPYHILSWPLIRKDEIARAQNCDVVINLSGESIAAKKWTTEQKRTIKDSRIKFTSQLIDILRGSLKLKVFISSSAIGYYGHRRTEVLNESSPMGEGFLADVCSSWEKTALSFTQPSLRTIVLRTGVVLSRGNGFLKELEPLFHHWVGGPVGSGDQMISWIHINDWIRAVVYCMENSSISGPVNLVSPEPASNRAMTATLCKFFRQPFNVSAPAFAIKVILGEMASMALESQNVRPEKLLQNGFTFLFPELVAALNEIFDMEKNQNQIYNQLQFSTWIPEPIDRVFKFFSDEKNLELITPAQLNFNVLKKSTSEIIKGTLIDYKLKVRGIPLKWRTLISDWQPPHEFTDQQVEGPYDYWSHTHSFESFAGGTLMKDKIDYKLPFGIMGKLIGGKFILKDLNTIFDYRQRSCKDLGARL